ncbi:MAG TPA: ABC transporter permease [Polyangiales bacterium]|nr:ABC transporter permease [Polyangiales bacterium]
MQSETLRMALQVLIRKPGRSALTVLGLIIGVAAFIAMVSFGQGARRSVIAQFESLGSNILRVRSRAGSKDALNRPPRPLSAADVGALVREATSIRVVVPHARRTVDLNFGGVAHRTQLYGTTPEYAPLHEWEVVNGGMFADDEAAQGKKLCVLGATPVQNLFGSRDPLGETLVIAGKFPCRVVGVLEAKGRSIGGGDQDDLVLMPLRTFELMLGVPDGYTSIELKPIDPSWMDAARSEVTDVVRRTHRIGPSETPDFDVISPDDVTRAADQTSKILTGLLAGIAAVSLLVGGIGIMNIQLVSVAERTHEIGIRAAIGASPAQIMRQFLVESCVLSGIGALTGVAIGFGMAQVVANFMHWPSVISAGAIIGSGLFGFAVGVVFGYIPALRAARLDPIAALRRE